MKKRKQILKKKKTEIISIRVDHCAILRYKFNKKLKKKKYLINKTTKNY